MRKFALLGLIALFSLTACEGPGSFRDLPEVGIVQCGIGTQILGCEYKNLRMTLASQRVYVVDCKDGSQLILPIDQCIVIKTIHLPEGQVEAPVEGK